MQSSAVPSPWKVARVRNVQHYTANIAICNNNLLHPAIFEPRKIFYATCQDKRLPLDDFIIARHHNTSSQFDGSEVVSILTSARMGVAKQLLDLFFKRKTNAIIQLHFQDDHRVRLGITAPINDSAAINSLLDFVWTIDKVVPFPGELLTVAKAFANQQMNELQIDSLFPFDKEANPLYFKFSEMTLFMGSYFETYTDDAEFTTELPIIHQAILEGNEDDVAGLLLADPNMANYRDPWGIPAHTLARKFGTCSMYKAIVDARKSLLCTSMGDQWMKHNEHFLLQKWLATGTPNPIQIGNVPSRDEASNIARRKYDAVRATPKHERNRFHTAVILGNIQEVIETLTQHPERMEEQDPRGYTALFLAAANGHANIVRWLLANGASHETITFDRPFFNLVTLRLIDSAKTPEVMQAILQYRSKPLELHYRLLLAIQQNDLRMARYLTYYIQQWPQKHGLNAYELAMKYSMQFGPDMTKTLLVCHSDFVPMGPYDQDLPKYIKQHLPALELDLTVEPLTIKIHPDVFPLMEEHNSRLMRRQNQTVRKVKLMSDILDQQGLISEFFTTGLKIKSVISRCSAVGDKTEDIHELYYKTFSLLTNDTPENRDENLKCELLDTEECKTYINRFYHDGKLIAFMTFEILEIEDRLVFHGNLAVTLHDELYTSQNLMLLTYRVMMAMKLTANDKKCYLYINGLYPGMGLGSAIFGDIAYYPKHITPELDSIFVEKIVKKAGEKWVDGRIQEYIKVNDSRPHAQTRHSNFFQDMNGSDPSFGMPVCYEVNDAVVTNYFKRLKANNIDPISVSNFTMIWKEFISKKTPLQLLHRQKM